MKAYFVKPEPPPEGLAHAVPRRVLPPPPPQRLIPVPLPSQSASTRVNSSRAPPTYSFHLPAPPIAAVTSSSSFSPPLRTPLFRPRVSHIRNSKKRRKKKKPKVAVLTNEEDVYVPSGSESDDHVILSDPETERNEPTRTGNTLAASSSSAGNATSVPSTRSTRSRRRTERLDYSGNSFEYANLKDEDFVLDPEDEAADADEEEMEMKMMSHRCSRRGRTRTRTSVKDFGPQWVAVSNWPRDEESFMETVEAPESLGDRWPTQQEMEESDTVVVVFRQIWKMTLEQANAFPNCSQQPAFYRSQINEYILSNGKEVFRRMDEKSMTEDELELEGEKGKREVWKRRIMNAVCSLRKWGSEGREQEGLLDDGNSGRLGGTPMKMWVNHYCRRLFSARRDAQKGRKRRRTGDGRRRLSVSTGSSRRSKKSGSKRRKKKGSRRPLIPPSGHRRRSSLSPTPLPDLLPLLQPPSNPNPTTFRDVGIGTPTVHPLSRRDFGVGCPNPLKRRRSASGSVSSGDEPPPKRRKLIEFSNGEDFLVNFNVAAINFARDPAEKVAISRLLVSKTLPNAQKVEKVLETLRPSVLPQDLSEAKKSVLWDVLKRKVSQSCQIREFEDAFSAVHSQHQQLISQSLSTPDLSGLSLLVPDLIEDHLLDHLHHQGIADHPEYVEDRRRAVSGRFRDGIVVSVSCGCCGSVEEHYRKWQLGLLDAVIQKQHV